MLFHKVEQLRFGSRKVQNIAIATQKLTQRLSQCLRAHKRTDS